jgi:hypothetical protein
LVSNAFVGSGALLTGITKSMVGLGNVDNTPDSAKSVNYANSSGMLQIVLNYL